jgi:hypothetical protein
MSEIVGQVAGAIALGGFVPYLVSIARGRTVPNRATWWIWTVVGTMLCASYYAAGARDSIWVPLGYVIGPLATALLALRYGEGGSSHFDRACLAGAAGALLLWWLSGSPLVGLVASIAVDAAGALPTLRKTYLEPWTESGPTWSIFLLANALNLAALDAWSLDTALYPLYLFGVSLGMVALIYRPRRLASLPTAAPD